MKDFYAAVLARDRCFDGKFVVAVRTTGVYCRPICPARPKPENLEFFPDAVAAEEADTGPVCAAARNARRTHLPGSAERGYNEEGRKCTGSLFLGLSATMNGFLADSVFADIRVESKKS